MTTELSTMSQSGISAVLAPYMPIFYVSFLVTLILTPLMRRLAMRNGIVDEPDQRRKLHAKPIAYLGGVATFLGWLAGISLTVFITPHNAQETLSHSIQIPPGILMGASLIVLVGLMDDIYGLSPKIKLLGQMLAALLLVLPGQLLSIGPDLFLGENRGLAWMILLPLERYHLVGNYAALSIPIQGYLVLGATIASALAAVFLIIATCNAANLLDGLDGLCSGVTGIMSLGYLILAAYLASQQVLTPVSATGVAADPTRIALSLALLGAVLGFLPYNFNPASIFMGDTGSMFLGYMCGTMMLLFGQDGIVRWFLAAIVIFGLPLMDTLLAIVRRKLNGQPIFSPDANHFHHFLIRQGLTVKRAVLLSYALTAVFVSFALAIVVVPTRLAMGAYLILFGWLIVAAFKIGMIFQDTVPPVIEPPTPRISVAEPLDHEEPVTSRL